MDWFLLATKLPLVISGIMSIVDRIKAPGAEKKAAVLAAIPESVALAELLAGKDLVNDEALAQLISAYIDAEAVALKAKAALQAGIRARAGTPPVRVMPPPPPAAPPVP